MQVALSGLVLVLLLGVTVATKTMSCEEARLLCLYRTGCSNAMQMYMWKCPGTGGCPEHCQHALIALTSTPEGKQLMTCECSDNSCLETKQRAEVCRPHVLWATRNESVVSCRIAQSICHADAECANALEYYHMLCRAMFHGKKCTRRCKNSISILRRQHHASKLNTCLCDGREEYDCAGIQENMARLCFPTNESATSSTSLSDAGSTSTNSLPDLKKKDYQQDAPALASNLSSASILVLCLALAVTSAVT